jgi:hypothetical protein
MFLKEFVTILYQQELQINIKLNKNKLSDNYKGKIISTIPFFDIQRKILVFYVLAR